MSSSETIEESLIYYAKITIPAMELNSVNTSEEFIKMGTRTGRISK
jgi:hypothetical protein